VIVETTVPVGTTQSRRRTHRRGGGMALGSGFALAFSRARVVGRVCAIWRHTRDRRRRRRSTGAPSRSAPSGCEVRPVRDAETAGFSKLAGRRTATSTALANEFARLADALGVDADRRSTRRAPVILASRPRRRRRQALHPVYPYFLASEGTALIDAAAASTTAWLRTPHSASPMRSARSPARRWSSSAGLPREREKSRHSTAFGLAARDIAQRNRLRADRCAPTTGIRDHETSSAAVMALACDARRAGVARTVRRPRPARIPNLRAVLDGAALDRQLSRRRVRRMGDRAMRVATP
jgi:hypothetical protein